MASTEPNSDVSCSDSGGCATHSGSETAAATSACKRENIMPEIKECIDKTNNEAETNEDGNTKTDELAEDMRHVLSTSKQHIIQSRPGGAQHGGSSIDSDPPDTPPRPRRHRISSRVHFPEDVHDPEIHVSRERDGGVDVNLGFLQVHHRYKCCFTVINSVVGEVNSEANQHVIVKTLAAFPNHDGDGHDIELEILSHKDGVLSEDFDLISKTDDTKRCKIVLHSRFLGKDQGTPLLKEGIHCIAMVTEDDETDESSDSATGS